MAAERESPLDDPNQIDAQMARGEPSVNIDMAGSTPVLSYNTSHAGPTRARELLPWWGAHLDPVWPPYGIPFGIMHPKSAALLRTETRTAVCLDRSKY